MQNEKRQLKKLVFSSHDRQNLSDDSSSFDIQFDQISDVSQFILRKAYIPLSTSTFQVDDDDRNWEISSVQGPAKIRNTSITPYYMNFLYYTRPLSPYGYGTFSPYEMIKPRIDGLFKSGATAPGTAGSVAFRIFNAVSDANNASYLQTWAPNNQITYGLLAQQLTTFCSQQTNLQGFILQDLKFKDNWMNPYLTNTECQNAFGSQTVFSHPDESDDPDRDVIYFYNTHATSAQNFNVNIGWYQWNNGAYDIPLDRSSLIVNMNVISVRNPSGNYIYGIRAPNQFCNYDQTLVGFFSTVYTNDSLVAHLNTQIQSRFGITFSKVPIGDGVDKISIASTPNTGYRRIDSVNDPAGFVFRRLGFRYSAFSPTVELRNNKPIGPWENIVSTVQPIEPLNIYYEIKCAVIQIMGTIGPNAFPEVGMSNGTHLFSDLILQSQFKSPNLYDFPNMNINLELVNNDPNPINPGYYSIKMSSPDTACRRLEISIDNKSRQIYVAENATNYYYKLAAGVPTASSTVSGGLLFQPYFTPPMVQQTLIEKNVWWPNPLPDLMNVSFDTTTYYTEASLLSAIQVVSTLTPALTFSIINHKLSIANSSESKGYLFEANDRLGIPIDITVPPLTTKIMTHDIDLSSLNDVVYVGLSLYSDGSNGVNKNIRLTGTPNQPRPQRKNIVASIVNTNDTNYGKYLVFDNQTEDWMKCDRTDFSNIHVDVYDSEYNLLNLNGITSHFSIIFR